MREYFFPPHLFLYFVAELLELLPTQFIQQRESITMYTTGFSVREIALKSAKTQNVGWYNGHREMKALKTRNKGDHRKS